MIEQKLCLLDHLDRAEFSLYLLPWYYSSMNTYFDRTKWHLIDHKLCVRSSWSALKFPYKWPWIWVNFRQVHHTSWRKKKQVAIKMLVNLQTILPQQPMDASKLAKEKVPATLRLGGRAVGLATNLTIYANVGAFWKYVKWKPIRLLICTSLRKVRTSLLSFSPKVPMHIII